MKKSEVFVVIPVAVLAFTLFPMTAFAGISKNQTVCTGFIKDQRITSAPLAVPLSDAVQQEWKAYVRSINGDVHDSECTDVFNKSNAYDEVEWLSSAYQKTGWHGSFPIAHEGDKSIEQGPCGGDGYCISGN